MALSALVQLLFALVSKDMDTEVRKVPLGVTASYVPLLLESSILY